MSNNVNANRISDTHLHFYLNFHGIGTVIRPYEFGEEPFWINRADLQRMLDLVDRHPNRERIRLTFDDGNQSDYAVAAPELRRRSLAACFFVLARRLDQKGYLSKAQVRELSEQGFQIGSHGCNHIDWTTAPADVLLRELQESKAIIEHTIGHSVQCAAIPFGAYDRRVLRTLADCNYNQVFSSDGGPRLTKAWPTPRYSVRRGDNVEKLRRRIDIGHTFLSRARTEMRVQIKGTRATRIARLLSQATKQRYVILRQS